MSDRAEVSSPNAVQVRSNSWLRRTAVFCVGAGTPLGRVFATRHLHIGFNAGRPWCYLNEGKLRGQDIAACESLARMLGAQPVFVECARSEMIDQLRSGALDIGIGGLVDQDYDAIRCAPAMRLEPVEGFNRYRQIFFPTVWWMHRDQTLWFIVLRSFLVWHRIRRRLTLTT